MDLGRVGWNKASTRTVVAAMIYATYIGRQSHQPLPVLDDAANDVIRATDALLAALEEDRRTGDVDERVLQEIIQTHYKARLREGIDDLHPRRLFPLSTSEKEYIRAHPEWWEKTKLIIQQDVAAEETDDT